MLLLKLKLPISISMADPLGVFPIDEENADKNAYRIRRPVRYKSFLFVKGQAVGFDDKEVYNAQALSDGVSGDIIAVKVVTGTVSI